MFVIHVEAFDWNCQQHITPRFTEKQIRSVLAPWKGGCRNWNRKTQRSRANSHDFAGQAIPFDPQQLNGDNTILWSAVRPSAYFLVVGLSGCYPARCIVPMSFRLARKS